MASDLFTQSAIAATAGTLTGANYVEKKVDIISPDSLLDFQVFICQYGGLSFRDVVFCLTAIITVRAALKVKDIKLGKLARRKVDKIKNKDKN